MAKAVRGGSKAGRARQGRARKTTAVRKKAATAPAPERAAHARPRKAFPVVGIGASAGGLEAIEAFFAAMPVSSGMAFVVVTHQHAGQASLMAELLSRRTSMPVVQASESTPLEPDHVYTSRPGDNLAVVDGVLQSAAVGRRIPIPMPVDYFFRSLAQDRKELAVGVILSGTGTDGTLGLKEIKAELGMVMAQDVKSAQYAGMPQSAVGTQLVDYVLPPEDMPDRLIAYERARVPAKAHEARHEGHQEPIQRVFSLLRGRTGHDFSQYKSSTVQRRIDRRIVVHHLGSMQRYVAYLRNHPEEIDLLFKELLIGVTSFFRDPEAWEALAGQIRQLLADKPDDYVLRAWVLGCSTGEEAYSLAILFREAMDEAKRSLSVQIFATDLDADAVASARRGTYPFGIANDLSATRLARFFTQEDDRFRVKKELREMVVFAPQDVLADPPFTKVDLLSCRNLLIYLDNSLQKKVFPLFHYAIKAHGILFLGSSESAAPFTRLFEPLDRKWKIFRRLDAPAGTYVADFPPAIGAGLPRTLAEGGAAGGTHGHRTLAQLAERAILKDLVPPTVIVRERGDVVHVQGRTGQFLEPAPGAQAAANVFNMAREGLPLVLTAAIRQAAGQDAEVVQRGVLVKTNGSHSRVDVRVRRLREPAALRGLFCISFERSVEAREEGPARGLRASRHAGARVVALENELEQAKESHRATTEELQSANEELQSTNEELQSTNEELQSANEELGTSKEELQSLNEELQTVNAELQGKVEELSHINDDMKNLLNGTDIATIFMDGDLRIKRFTEQAKKVIRLIPSDVGRPIGDLVSTLRYDKLVDDAQEVLRTLIPKEVTVEGARDGGEPISYLMRILPYRTTENVIDGLVLTFVDISIARRLEREQERLLATLAHSATSVFGSDRDLRYTWSYPSTVFGRRARDIEGKTDVAIFGPRGARDLLALKRAVQKSRKAARSRVELVVDGERRSYDVFVEPVREDGGVSCVATDITPYVRPPKGKS